MKPRRLVRATTLSITWSRGTVTGTPAPPAPSAPPPHCVGRTTSAPPRFVGRTSGPPVPPAPPAPSAPPPHFGGRTSSSVPFRSGRLGILGGGPCGTRAATAGLRR